MSALQHPNCDYEFTNLAVATENEVGSHVNIPRSFAPHLVAVFYSSACGQMRGDGDNSLLQMCFLHLDFVLCCTGLGASFLVLPALYVTS